MQGWFPNKPVKCNACGWIALNSLYYDGDCRHVTIQCKCVNRTPVANLCFMITHKCKIAWVRNGQKDYTDEIPFFTPPVPLKANLQYACGGDIVDDYEKQLQQQKPMPGWFPLYPLKCTQCNKIATELLFDDGLVNINCSCRIERTGRFQATTENSARYWIIDEEKNISHMERDRLCDAFPYRFASFLEFHLSCAVIDEWKQAIANSATTSVKNKIQLNNATMSDNNNSQIDNRRLEETDKRIVALQNEVHKLSNELETQTIMMRDEIGQLKRKLFRNELMCVICQTNQIDAALGCGHVFCSECAQSIQKCAFCRKEVQAAEIRKLFL